MIETNFPQDTKGVIQIGASSGQQIKLFIDNNIQDLILFEPCDRSFEELTQEAELYKDRSNIILSNYIVSNKTDEVEFFIGQNEHNSSLLDLHPDRPGLHQAANIHDRKEFKKSITLDDYFNNPDVDISLYDFLFMDAQGAEHIILEGATETLKHMKYIYLEVSFAEIYSGSMMYEDMLNYLKNLGFEFVWLSTANHMDQGDLLVKRVSAESTDSQ